MQSPMLPRMASGSAGFERDRNAALSCARLKIMPAGSVLPVEVSCTGNMITTML